VPEGDTIFRAARTMDKALAGRVVTGFEAVFPQLMRVDVDRPLRGRRIERVEARGKHLLIWFSGDLILRTHMRMKGSWHLYRPGERWQRPRADMRIVLRTEAFEAVAFSVPVAALETEAELNREPVIRELGPDPLATTFDENDAIQRVAARGDDEIADVLLDQRAIAGVGNVLKSETLFVAKVNPFRKVSALTPEELRAVVQTGARLLQSNSITAARQTTGRLNPGERLWVYGRARQPCLRCGTAIVRAVQGSNARSTYWCPSCQRD
jgi:endonuclease VIII